MQKKVRIAVMAIAGILCPGWMYAQDSGLSGEIKSLQSVLAQLYVEMLPLCSQLIGVGRLIAGFAALWYIAYRVWGHLARAEPIDFYPLFRPFVLGGLIVLFPAVISMTNDILSPMVAGTEKMVNNSDAAVAVLLKQKEEAVKKSDVWQMYVGESGSGDRDKWYKYTHPTKEVSDEKWYEGIGNDLKFGMAKISYNFRNSIKEVIAEILQLLFAAVALCINTMRTFNLLILAILGPLVFGISVFDGFQHTLKHWLARYINVFLWLPICNIFGAVIGKIQENMLTIDVSQIGQTGDTFFSRTDMGYLIFLIIGIIGYTTVPNIANHIVWVGGGDALTSKVTNSTAGAASATAGMGMAGMNRMSQGASNLDHAASDINAGYNAGGGSDGTSRPSQLGHAYGQASNYIKNKLSGNQNS